MGWIQEGKLHLKVINWPLIGKNKNHKFHENLAAICNNYYRNHFFNNVFKVHFVQIRNRKIYKIYERIREKGSENLKKKKKSRTKMQEKEIKHKYGQ